MHAIMNGVFNSNMFASKTAFAIGEIKQERFYPSRIVKGSHAYDAYHLHLYLEEILNSRYYLQRLAEGNISFSWDCVTRPDRLFALFLDFCLSEETGKQIVKTELGGSLLEIIDGYNILVEALCQHSNGAGRGDDHWITKWNSIEISPLFQKASQIIHPLDEIDIFTSSEEYIRRLELHGKGTSVHSLYDRAVSSYAFDANDTFVAFLSKFDFASLQILGFLERELRVEDPIGTNMNYFNLALLQSKLNSVGGKLYYYYGGRRPTRPLSLDKENDCIEAFFIFAKDSIPLDKIIRSATNSSFCKPFISQLGIRTELSNSLARVGIESIL